jgi:hypothetical protein
MNFIVRCFIVLVIEMVVGMSVAMADCARDRAGAVYCSQHPGGGAIRDNTGAVTCGKGQCRRDRNGAIRCSNVVGGGAEVDSTGITQCLGGCEPPSDSMCTKASI